MSADIFISFASQDMKIAGTICTALESRGFRCWISTRDILAGENFQSAIVRAIRSCKILLLVFTSNSNRSDEMTKELALASQQKLMVVPLRVEDVTPSDAFAYEFATRQWIDLFADWEVAMNQLCTRIGAALANEPHSTEPIVLGKASNEPAVRTAATSAAKRARLPKSALPPGTKSARPTALLLKVAVGAGLLIAAAAIAVPTLMKRSPPARTAATAPAAPSKALPEPATVVAVAPTVTEALPPAPPAATATVAPAPVTSDAPAQIVPDASSRDVPKEAPKPVERKKRPPPQKPTSNLPY